MPSSQNKSALSTNFTEADFRAAIDSYGGNSAKTLLNDARMFKSTFDLLRSVASGNIVAGTSAVASAVNTTAKYSSASTAVKNDLKSASFLTSEFKTTMDLVNATKLATPGAIIVFAGAAVVQKTGMAVSLVGGDEMKAKCLGAVMELAGSFTMTVVTAPTGVLAVLSVAALTASAFNATDSCRQYFP
jgi:hypothetical protein